MKRGTSLLRPDETSVTPVVGIVRPSFLLDF